MILKTLTHWADWFKKAISPLVEEVEVLEISDGKAEFYLQVTFYISKLKINTRSNRKHTMEGLFPKFKVNLDFVKKNSESVSLFSFGNIESLQLARHKVTLSEYYTGYKHSHTPAVNSAEGFLNFSSFCLGNTKQPIYKAMELVANAFEEELEEEALIESVESFIFTYLHYLSYESTEGIPYNRISSVKRFKKDFISKRGIEYRYIMRDIINEKLIDKIIENSWFDLKLKDGIIHIEATFKAKSFLAHHNNSISFNYFEDLETGEIYSPDLMSFLKNTEGLYFQFNNKSYPLEIIDASPYNTDVLRPSLPASIIDCLNYRIKKKLLNGIKNKN